MPYPSYPLANREQFIDHAQHAAGLIVAGQLLTHKDQAANDAVCIISFAASFVPAGAPVVFGAEKETALESPDGTLDSAACARLLDEAVEFAHGDPDGAAMKSGGFNLALLIKLAMLILQAISAA